MLLELHRPDVTDPVEARALAQSIETWQRPTGGLAWYSFDRILPYYNGRAQRREPPGLTWAHMLAFNSVSLFHRPTSVDALVLIGRVVSVLLGLLAVAAAFWAGRSMGNSLTATLAGLLCAAHPLLLYYARQASPPMAHAALTLLAIAAALWAIRPLKPAPSIWRQGLGWGLAGVAFAGALLVTPVALLTVPLPILLILILIPGRLSHLLGLLAAVLIGVLLLTPWVVYVHTDAPDTWRYWLVELAPLAGSGWELAVTNLGRRALAAVILTLPWTLWLFGAIAQPFSTSSKGSRPRLFMSWVWFITVTTVLLAMGRENEHWGFLGFLLPVVPAAAVLIAQLFTQYHDLASEGRHARGWQRLRYPFLAILLAASLLVPLALHAQPMLKQPFAWDMPWPLALASAILLLGLVTLSIHWMNREFPAKTMVVWCCWMLAMLLVVILPLSRGPLAVNPLRQAGADVAALTQDVPVYWLDQPGIRGGRGVRGGESWGSSEETEGWPDPALILYSGRPIPLLRVDQFSAALEEVGEFNLLTGTHPPMLPNLLVQARLRLPMLDRVLYTFTRAAPAPPTTQPAEAPATQPATTQPVE